SLQEKIKEQKRKLELLQQLEELERKQNNLNKENKEINEQIPDNNSDIPPELKKGLLDNLQNLFKE
ncbi:TPA: initiator RepB protein, partial [Salmonella enterica]|nr:initiator RepB protein [Salmonella enterica]